MTDNVNLTENNSDSKLYEIGYLLSPLVPTETKEDTVAKEIKEAIIQNGGQVEGEIMPAHIKLAYPVSKTLNHKHTIYKEAYFGALRFTVLPGQLALVRALIDKSPVILRSLITTPAPGSVFEIPATKETLTEKTTLPEGGEEVVPAVVEATPSAEEADVQNIDKEIDNLLVSNA